MNQSTVSGKWQELKGEIRTRWGKLTDNELEATKGNVESIAGLIQQRYGDVKEVATQQLSSFLDHFYSRASDIDKDVGREVADRTEKIKESLQDSSKNHH